MSHFFIIAFLVIIPHTFFAQVRWDGGAGTDQWADALNWSGNSLPTITDQVIIDNSVVGGSYIIVLPEALAIAVRNITINPAGDNTIELIVPQASTLVPALTATGPGNALVLNKGAVFRNASATSSGISFDAQDSIRINNGGRYIHNSGGAHAANVAMLSAAPGTEEGAMEFDIPDASSTISFSGRTFGMLELKASSGAAPKNYTAAGTNPVRVRSDLVIHEGVNLKLNFDDSIFIHRDLIQLGGVLDLGTTARTARLVVSGRIDQRAGATITESGTGSQELILQGNQEQEQELALMGTINNSVALTMDSPEDARLLSPLNIPYHLNLRRGIIYSGSTALLTLSPGATVTADTIAGKSYVDGPIRKQGMAGNSFLFPVGKAAHMRWLAVEAGIDDMTVEYFPDDPRLISQSYGSGIDHISAREYWTLNKSSAFSCVVKCSFDQQYSGEVSNLADLRMALLSGGMWLDGGNSGTAGSAGFSGWMRSNNSALSGNGMHQLTLASATASNNSLPITRIYLKVTDAGSRRNISWRLEPGHSISECRVQCSSDGRVFSNLYVIPTVKDQLSYYWVNPKFDLQKTYYRIEAVDMDGTRYFSNIISATNLQAGLFSLPSTLITNDLLVLHIETDKVQATEARIISIEGRILMKQKITGTIMNKVLELPLPWIHGGLYIVELIFENGSRQSLRFVKQ